MSRPKNSLRATVIGISLLVCVTGHASDGKGNGGDFIRQLFIERGNQIVSFLEKKESTLSFFRRNEITSKSLRNVLRIEVIKVSAEALKDNQGSAVDAIGAPGRIVLDQSAWRTYLMKGIKLDRMILHEMLRAIGKNDDNYIISRTMPDLPSFSNQDRVSAGYRLLREEFAESRMPTDEELARLSGQRMDCARYVWDQAAPVEFGDNYFNVWRKDTLMSYGDRGALFYIDRDLGTISGLDKDLFVLMRTHTGAELISELIYASDSKSPVAVSNQSMRARYYYICELLL